MIFEIRVNYMISFCFLLNFWQSILVEITCVLFFVENKFDKVPDENGIRKCFFSVFSQMQSWCSRFVCFFFSSAFIYGRWSAGTFKNQKIEWIIFCCVNIQRKAFWSFFLRLLCTENLNWSEGKLKKKRENKLRLKNEKLFVSFFCCFVSAGCWFLRH